MYIQVHTQAIMQRNTVALISTDRTLAIEDSDYVVRETTRSEPMQDVDNRMKSVAEHHGSRLHYDSRGSNDVHSRHGATCG